MAKKIVFIGAGSFGFTRKLANDILTFPAFEDCELALVDLDAERLAYIERCVKKIAAAHGGKAKVTAYTDRTRALEGADGVLITILAHGLSIWRNDMEIPKKYGVDLNIGDTRGPAGIFRFLRTAQAMLDICRDIERLAPRAIVLNYTNPMAMLCRLLQAETSVNVTGLCHSVQKTAAILARWIDADINDVTYTCAGINHQAFYLDYKVRGVDAYPAIRKAIETRQDVYDEEQVRNEMFLYLDYYVTESSGHASEYSAWFRKRPDLIEKYCTHSTSWNPGVYAYLIQAREKRDDNYRDAMETWLANPDINLERSPEYASRIFNAGFGDGLPFEFNGNVRNFGLIDNLPYGCCVESPVTVSKNGLRPSKVGMLPAHLSALIGVNATCEELAVEGFIHKDRRMIYHAVLNDPLTGAVLSMKEAKDMTDEMLDYNKPWTGI